MALSGATTPGQSEPGSDSNERVLCITGTLPSDCLMLYLGYTLGWGGSYPSAEVQLVYSTAPADWAIISVLSVLFVTRKDKILVYLVWKKIRFLLKISGVYFNRHCCICFQSYFTSDLMGYCTYENI